MEKLNKLTKLAINDGKVRLYDKSEPDSIVLPDEQTIIIGDHETNLREFLQWWGKCVWEEAAQNEREVVAQKLVKTAKQDIKAKKNFPGAELWASCAESFLLELAYHVKNDNLPKQ